MQVREAFDALLTWLERFNHYVESQLVSVADLAPYLRYWVDRIVKRDPEFHDEAFYTGLHNFILDYQYDGVRSLLEKFHAYENTRSESPRSIPPPQGESCFRKQAAARHVSDAGRKRGDSVTAAAHGVDSRSRPPPSA